jgi:hypothetical protein
MRSNINATDLTKAITSQVQDPISGKKPPSPNNPLLKMKNFE